MEEKEQGNEYIPESANSDDAASELNKAFEVPEDCNTVNSVWQRAMSEGLVLPGFEQLEKAVLDLKDAISDDILYNGSTDKIHDNNVITRRSDLIGKIGAKLNDYIDGVLASPVPRRQVPIEGIHEKLGSFINTLKSAIDAAKTEQTREPLKAFIRLHFYCFKNCYKTECLQMD